MAGGEWEIPFLCYITYNQRASGLLFIFSMIRYGVLPDSGKMYGAYLLYDLMREFFSWIQIISFLSFATLLSERRVQFSPAEMRHTLSPERELQ